MNSTMRSTYAVACGSLVGGFTPMAAIASTH